MSSKIALTPQQRKSLWRMVGLSVMACAAVTTASYFIEIRPAAAHLAEQSQSIELFQEHQRKASELQISLGTTKNRLEQATREVNELPLRLEPASVVNKRLNRLAQVAAEAGVTLNELQPLPAIDGQHYQTVPIRVTGSGTYPAFAGFLHTLRAQFPDITIRAFDATNPSPAATGNAATFRIDLEWHTTPVKK